MGSTTLRLPGTGNSRLPATSLRLLPAVPAACHGLLGTVWRTSLQEALLNWGTVISLLLLPIAFYFIYTIAGHEWDQTVARVPFSRSISSRHPSSSTLLTPRVCFLRS